MFIDEMGIFTIALAIFILAMAYQSVKIVPQAQVWVIERLGRYNRTLTGGLNFIVPFVDTVRAKYHTQEQVVDIQPQAVITRDNVSITIDGIVFLRISDGRMATYEILDLKQAISQLAQTTLRSEIGKMDLDDTLSSRDQLNSALLYALDTASANWGAKVTRVEIANITVPPEVQNAMELQLKAERERRATETEAEGQKNATIAIAEGDRQKAFKEAEAIERTAEAQKYEQIQLAEGQQQAMEMINQAMGNNPQAAEFLLAKDRIEAFNGIANSDSQNKVVIPYQAVDLIGSITTVTDMLNLTNNASGQK